MNIVFKRNLLIQALKVSTLSLILGTTMSYAEARTYTEESLPLTSAPQDLPAPDLISVVAALHDQMYSWQGTPYHWGGTKLSGVDCSGFVWRTLKDRFNIPMDRVTTTQLITMGQPVAAGHLQPGDLVFFRIKNSLHVGFYDTNQQFLHASVSKGVMRSSLNNPYWKSVYLEARRLQKEQGAQITFNSSKPKMDLANN